MSYTLQIVDSSDNLLFDLNDPTGANNLYGLRTYAWEVNYGSPTGNPSFFQSSIVPGGSHVNHQHELVTMEWKQSWQKPEAGMTIDQERAAVAEMFRLLDLGGILKEKGASSETTRYIDFEYGSLSAMLRGQSIGAVKLFSQQLDPDGMPLQIMRQPYFRRAVVSTSENYAGNATLLRDSDANGRPDNWTWTSTTGLSAESIDAATESYKFTVASAVARDLYNDTAAASAAPSDVWTVSYEAKVSSGSTARVRAMAFWLNSSAAQVGSDQTGTLTALTSSFQWVTVTTSAAPASTDRVRGAIRVENSDGSANVIHVRRVKIEKSSARSSFVLKSQSLSNDPGTTSTIGRVFSVFNAGSAPAPFQFTITPSDASAKLQSLLLGVRSSYGTVGAGYLSDYMNTTKVFQCESGTLTNSTSSVASASESGGNVARVAFGAGSTTDLAQKRVRIQQTTKLDSLRGLQNVYLRCKPSTGKKFGITLKWAASTANPAPNTETEVIHDTTTNGLASYDYVELFLGQIYIPESGSLSGVSFEIWVRNITGGSVNFDMDFLTVVPASLSASLDVPYIGRISTLGKDANLSSATADGNSAVMNAAGRVSLDFATPAAARYRATFRYSIRDAGGSTDLEFVAGTYTGAYAVGTPPTGVTSHHETGAIVDGTNLTYAIEWDGNGTSKYRVDAALITAGGATVTIHQIDIETLPYVGQNEQVFTDPTDLDNPAVYKRDSSGNISTYIGTKGPPVFWLPPGLSVIYMAAFEPRVGGLYTELKSDISRSFTVTYSYAPRDLA